MFLIFNGTLSPVEQPLLPAGDGLAAYGFGLFETLAAYQGRPFQFEAHYRRLREGAARLGLTCPKEEALWSAMGTLLEKNGLQDAARARLRLTLSSPGPGKESWWLEATSPPAHAGEAVVYTDPALVRNERSLLVGLKCTQGGDSLLAQRLAREQGGDEALFCNTRGELCEGAWSNLFVKIEGQWCTPPLDSGCLPGITRATVLGLFAELGLAAQERPVPASLLDRIEAAFLTSSLREIQPVARLGGRALDQPSEIARLQAAYRQQTEIT